MENIETLKRHPSESARLTYKLENANVYVSPRGFHFTDYLDPVEEISPQAERKSLGLS